MVDEQDILRARRKQAGLVIVESHRRQQLAASLLSPGEFVTKGSFRNEKAPKRSKVPKCGRCGKPERWPIRQDDGEETCIDCHWIRADESTALLMRQIFWCCFGCMASVIAVAAVLIIVERWLR